jgi:hypothetical protein
MRIINKPSLVILMSMLLTACGDSGPTKGDIQKLLEQAVNQVNNSDGQLAGSVFAVPNITVDSASCTPGQNAIYSCLVTETSAGTTQATTISVTRSNGNWVLVDNRN